MGAAQVLLGSGTGARFAGSAECGGTRIGKHYNSMSFVLLYYCATSSSWRACKCEHACWRSQQFARAARGIRRTYVAEQQYSDASLTPALPAANDIRRAAGERGSMHDTVAEDPQRFRRDLVQGRALRAEKLL